MHRHFNRHPATESALESTQIGPALTSPFIYALPAADPAMIKHAAPQHPQALTKLQHRLLYESDSDSSFDLTFSSPSSVGSASEYSDVGYQSSARSRTSSYGAARRMGRHSSASRSESISSVLGSSIAIQRVLMGHNSSSSVSSKNQRQSVRAIASAFEQVGRGPNADLPKVGRRQLDRVDEHVASNGARQAQPLRSQQPPAPAAGQSVDAQTTRRAGANGPLPARLVISKEPVRGPLSAPAVITAPGSQASSEPQFTFPPRAGAPQHAPTASPPVRVRSFISLGERDDDEPVFDIIPSPSRKRSFGLPPASALATPQPRTDTVPHAPQSASASPLDSPRSLASRDSMMSTYSNDSLGEHPFSLQLPTDDDGERRVSAVGSLHFDLGGFPSPCMDAVSTGRVTPVRAEHVTHAAPCADEGSTARASTTLQPLLLSTSRPSSSSSCATLAASSSATLASCMRINNSTTFPLPPSSFVKPAARTIREMRWPLGQTRDLGAESGADTTLAVDQLRREAQAILDSIREVGEEIDRAIPPTHRLPGSGYREKKAASPTTAETPHTTSFVKVDQSYSDVWRIVDSWYWSSFEVGPSQT
ncbi:uncharacterized protein PSANT_04236 [Moesziomyces antarcticus]|nr:uncharacterized protein PSANT_04236 [Moesziomyces antarcticus]